LPASFKRFAMGLMIVSAPAHAGAHSWELVGKTYNSVAFLDRESTETVGSVQIVTVMRVSGQPTKDRWRSTTQQIRVDCATGTMGDAGSIVEGTDGSENAYGPTPATRTVPTRGIFADLYQSVCHERQGIKLSDPKSWTLRNFRPGD
jgi:hypothetical protein